jgi:hypothetical protein
MVLENPGALLDFDSGGRSSNLSGASPFGEMTGPGEPTHSRANQHEKDHTRAGVPLSGRGAGPPTFGGKPLVVVGSKKEAAKPLSPAQKLQACQDIDDATKERLNCYDAIYAPQPKPKPAAAKSVTECRFQKEEDERLTCYNGFADKIPKLPR